MWIWLTGHAIRLNDCCQQVWAATDHLRITPAAAPVVTFLPRSTQKSLLHHYISTEYALLYYYTRLNSHYCIITWLLSSHDCNRSTHEGQTTAILTLHCFFQSGKFRVGAECSDHTRLVTFIFNLNYTFENICDCISHKQLTCCFSPQSATKRVLQEGDSGGCVVWLWLLGVL